MDYIMIYRLLQCMREGLAPDMDVYDGGSLVGAYSLEQDFSGRKGSASRSNFMTSREACVGARRKGLLDLKD